MGKEIIFEAYFLKWFNKRKGNRIIFQIKYLKLETNYNDWNSVWKFGVNINN